MTRQSSLCPHCKYPLNPHPPTSCPECGQPLNRQADTPPKTPPQNQKLHELAKQLQKVQDLPTPDRTNLRLTAAEFRLNSLQQQIHALEQKISNLEQRHSPQPCDLK